MKLRWTSVLTALTLLALPALHAAIRLPHMLSDHGVLQRDRPIHIWGWSDPKEQVTVKFHDQTVTTTANQLGAWQLWLTREAAGGPYELTVTGSNGEQPLQVEDLLVGDVWFASGQSNMQIPLNGFPGSAVIKNAAQEIANSSHPQIRLLRFDMKASPYPLNDLPDTWTPCDPSTAADFSAIAYFFGRDLQDHLHVPIGLIDSTWGGTPLQAWMSMESLSADAGFMPVFESWAKFADQQTNLEAEKAYEKRAVDAAKAANQPAPQFHWHPNPESWDPAWLYNGMVAPATPYTIRGFLWYQGETNSDPLWVPMLYKRLFPAMITDWRNRWQEGSLPFLFVQISNFDSPHEDWGEIRNAQRLTLSLDNTAMAVTLDVGERDNVHPPDKQTVAHRLAQAALAIDYGEDVTYQGPSFEQIIRQGDHLRVYFEHHSPGAHGLTTQGGPLKGFEIEAADHTWQSAEATIDGNQVLVTIPAGVDPLAVRYGWASWTDANLFNTNGFPASTFKAELPQP